MEVPPKNARPLLGGEGDMDGDDAEDVEGFGLLLPGGGRCGIPGQKVGFQGAE